jgi:nitroreductase
MPLIPEIETRRARRGFAEKPLEEASLKRILEAARLAPSCANKQPWRFVLLKGGTERVNFDKALSDGNYWAKKAPAVVLVLTNPERDMQLSDRRDYSLFDAGLAAMNLMLQAEKEGVIAHPIAGFDPEKAKAAAGVPDKEILITCIILGLPGDDKGLSDNHKEQEKAGRTRKSFDSLVSVDRWENPWLV